MGRQLTGVITAPTRRRRSKLNALEAAKLADCIRAGMTTPRMTAKGTPTADLPLFACHNQNEIKF